MQLGGHLYKVWPTWLQGEDPLRARMERRHGIPAQQAAHQRRRPRTERRLGRATVLRHSERSEESQVLVLLMRQFAAMMRYRARCEGFLRSDCRKIKRRCSRTRNDGAGAVARGLVPRSSCGVRVVRM